MCRVEFHLHTCGHTTDHSTRCEDAAPYGPFFNRIGCVNYTSKNSRATYQCGEHRFYCAKTHDGAILESSYSLLEELRNKLIETHDQLKEVMASSQLVFQQSAESEGMHTDHRFEVLEQLKAELLEKRISIISKARALQEAIRWAFQERHLLMPFPGRPEYIGFHINPGESSLPQHILIPLLQILAGQDCSEGVQTESKALSIPVQSQHKSTPVYSEAPSRSAIGKIASQDQRLKHPNTPMRAHDRSASTAVRKTPLGHETFRGNSPPNESRAEKAHRLRAEMKAKQNQKIAESMAQQGYDVQKEGIRPPARARRPRPGPTKASPSKIQSSPKPSSSAQAASQNVRRSTRTRNSKPKYAESSGGSSLGLSSRDTSPAKSDAAWHESPGRSEGSSSPYKPTKGDRSHKKKVAALSPISDPTYGQRSLSNKILEYGKSFEKAENNTSVSIETAPSRSNVQPSEQDSIQSGTLADPINKSFAPAGEFPRPVRTRLTGAYSGPNPIAPVASVNDRMQESLLQAIQPEILPLGRLMAPGGYGYTTSNAMFAHHGRNPSMSKDTTYPSSVQMSPPGQTLQPAPLQPTRQLYQRNFTEPANIFHRNYLQAMASHAALPAAFVGDNGFTGRNASRNIIDTSSGDNSMPTLTSSFNPNTNTQPDYTRMHRSFSSAADLTTQSLPGAERDIPSFEPTKRMVPSESPSMAPFKRPRLDDAATCGAPAPVPDRPRNELGSPIDLPTTNALGSCRGNETFYEYQNQPSASASDLAPPYHAQTLQHPSSSYPVVQGQGGDRDYLTIPENKAQQLHELPRRDSQYDHFQDAGQNRQCETKDPVSEPDWGFLDEENTL